jgi:hypothetical protein
MHFIDLQQKELTHASSANCYTAHYRASVGDRLSTGPDSIAADGGANDRADHCANSRAD